MDLRDFGSTLARWWYLTLAVLLLAIGAGIGLYKAAGPTYTANSTVLLLPPKAVLIEAKADKRNYAPDNPLLYLASLTDARDVLVRHLSSSDVSDQIEAKAPGAKVEVKGDVTSGSPLILVTAEGGSEQEALAGIKAVDGMVPDALKTLQDGMQIQSLQRITSIRVTEDSKATPESKKQIMAGAVGFGGTALLGLALIALLDQLRGRRKQSAPAQVESHGATASTTRPVDAKAQGTTAQNTAAQNTAAQNTKAQKKTTGSPRSTRA